MRPNSQADTQAPIRSDFADDPDYAELLNLFTDTLTEKTRDLQESFRAGKIDQLQTQAHQLKGAGGGYGFSGLTSVSAVLEDACRTNDVERVGEALDQVLNYLDRINL